MSGKAPEWLDCHPRYQERWPALSKLFLKLLSSGFWESPTLREAENHNKHRSPPREQGPLLQSDHCQGLLLTQWKPHTYVHLKLSLSGGTVPSKTRKGIAGDGFLFQMKRIMLNLIQWKKNVCVYLAKEVKPHHVMPCVCTFPFCVYVFPLLEGMILQATQNQGACEWSRCILHVTSSA